MHGVCLEESEEKLHFKSNENKLLQRASDF